MDMGEMIGTIIGALFFIGIILGGIPYIMYVSVKNEFGDGMYNKPKNEKDRRKEDR